MGNNFSALLDQLQENPYDAFWYQDINVGVLGVAAALEKEAYEQMTKPGR